MKRLLKLPVAAIFAALALFASTQAGSSDAAAYPRFMFWMLWASLGLTLIWGVIGVIAALSKQRSWELTYSDILALCVVGWAALAVLSVRQAFSAL